ncbi:helix-turn-helix domain-containing protein [Pseudonocardia sp. KRD-182]|uniref:PucR family transcriptional regulator n=1 Tax=Pseudonocardia oceani TaxID=2792013 RepID=UPI001C49FB94|nr:PucR family transcriptional regulator [Pseudonocardia oceani]MBW0110577.1 helix-turn-helix domain-containing protein [Pseudonocardia oceani]
MTLTAVDPLHMTDPLTRPSEDGAAGEPLVDHRLAIRLAGEIFTVAGSPASGEPVPPGDSVRGHRRDGDLPPAQALASLVRAVAEHDTQAFVERMHEFLGGAVTLVDATGATVATSCDGVHERPSLPGRKILIEADGLVVGSLRLPGAGWWSAAEEHLLRALGLVVLQGRRLTEEILDLRHRIALSDWLAPTARTSGGLVGHMTGSPGALCRPVVISLPAGVVGLPARALTDRIRRTCEEHPRLHTVTLVPRDGGLLGVSPEHDTADADAQATMWRSVLAELNTDGVAVSVGRPACAGDELRSSFDAAQTVAHLQRRGSSYLALPAVAVNEQLGPVADVLTAVSASRIPQFVERVLGELLVDDRFGGQLVETLHAYLTTGGSPQEAGRLLHMHASSVKYRMRVIRQLLGPRLEDPVQRFDLELAVRLYFAAQELAAVRRECS